MTVRTVLCALLLVGSLAAESAIAKGKTVQLTMTGPGLESPLHLSDEAAIAANVWTGNFADWDAGPIEPLAANAPQYVIHFWVKFAADDIQMKYVVGFQWDAHSHRGVICLPGQRSLWYRSNVYSILRKGQDGKCFYAEKEWGAAIRSALP